VAEFAKVDMQIVWPDEEHIVVCARA
jgi:hypothetical protein